MSVSVKNMGGGGSGSTGELTGNATVAQVLAGRTFYNTNPDSKLTGTMPNNGNTVTASAVIKGTQNNIYARIPYGYYSNAGSENWPNTSVVNMTESQIGSATAADVVSGKTFTSSAGVKLSGSISDVGNSQFIYSSSKTDEHMIGNAGAGQEILTPYDTSTGALHTASYLAFKIGSTPRYFPANSWLGTTVSNIGTATQAQVLSGKTFTSSNGVKISGTMTDRGAVTQSIAPGGSYTIPAGYHNGSGKVTATAAPSALALKITSEKNTNNAVGYTYTTTAAYTSCLIIANTFQEAQDTNLTIEVSGGGSVTAVKSSRVYNDTAPYAGGIAVYKGTNIAKGAKITVKAGSRNLYGVGLYILA